MHSSALFSRILTLSIPFVLIGLSCTNDEVQHFATSTEEFMLQPGYKIETIAAEPLLSSPLALDFDAEGIIWVVELPGYMRDIDGSDEEEPDGRIVRLTDRDGDGVLDRREVMLDGLTVPRTLLHAYGGLLFNDGASLYFANYENGTLGERILVDSLYVVGGNIEHQPNGLLYHLDNWIYSANSTARYRRHYGTWQREPTSFRGQWGLSADPEGRMVYNNNSLPMAVDYLMPNQLTRNDFQEINYGYNQAIATSNRLHGIQATAVNRGYIDGVLDEEGKVQEFTSAASPLVFTGNRLGDDARSDIFVCAPEANLLKRYDVVVAEDGTKQAVPVYDSTEFLISRDETFRPVNLYNAPDGSLYILDLRKGIIQHRAYMTSYLREKIIDRGLDTINNRGRIYRVTRGTDEADPFRNFARMSDAELVKLLASELPYERLTAQQQLISRNATAQQSAIEALARTAENPYGRLHALWTLEGLGRFKESLWLEMMREEQSIVVLETLIRFSEFLPGNEEDFLPHLARIAELNDARLDRQLALRLGGMKSVAALDMLLQLSERRGNDAVFSEALIAGLAGREDNFGAFLSERPNTDSLQRFLKISLENKRAGAVKSPRLPTKLYLDNRTAGFNLFNTYCGACHGLDGKGKENLSPPLVDSEYVNGSKDRLILLVLNGMHGPITVNGKRYEFQATMPGVKSNPALSDQDIADLLIFLRNSFSTADSWVTAERVAKWRAATGDRETLFTEAELAEY